MALSLRAASGNQNGATTSQSQTITLPTGTATNDLVYFVISVGAVVSSPAATGWSPVANDTGTTPASSSIVGYRTIQAGDGDPTVTWTGAGKVAWTAIAIAPATGNQAAHSSFATPLVGTTTATSRTPPATTATAGMASVVLGAHRASGNAATAITVTPSNNWVEPTNGEQSTAVGTLAAERQVAAHVQYRLGLSTGSVTPAAQTIAPTSYSVLSHAMVVEQTAGPSTISWSADLSQTSLSAMGFSLWQRQTDAGVFTNSTTTTPPTVTNYGGRSGTALQMTISDTERRNEVVPNHRDITTGDSVYFAQAFYLDTGYPIDPTPGVTDDFQIIDQIHQAWGNYSPPVAFEVIDNVLKLTGGYGLSRAPQVGGSEATDPTIYQHFQNLAPITVGQWYGLVYYINNFSQTPGASTITVWLNGTAVLTNWTIPPPTLVQGDAASIESYRKIGIYHDNALPGLTVYQAAHAAGQSYAAVDPGVAATGSGGMAFYPFFVA